MGSGRPDRAFVAGATGYTGRAVVAELRRRGIATIAHIRPDSSRLSSDQPHFESLGAEVDLTPWDAAAISARIHEVAPTLVFALLGTTRARARRVARAGGDPGRASYEYVDVGLTAMLVEAAKGVPGFSRFVYLSSLGVRARAVGAYLQARWRVESLLNESGLPFTIARPAFITGPDRLDARPLERGGAVVSNGVLGLCAALGWRSPLRRYGSMRGDELARALVHHALLPESVNQVIEAPELRAHSE